MTDSEKIAVLMKNLGISEDDAREVIAADKAIDKGEKMPFDLTPEQEKATRKYRTADRDADKEKPKAERKRKENPGKRAMIDAMQELFSGMCDKVEVTNPEREILIEWANVKYKIVLSCPRK